LIRFNIWFNLVVFMMGLYLWMHLFLMDNGFNPILLVGNLARSGQAMHEIFLATKKVYLKCILGLVWSLLMNMGLGHMGFKVGLG